MHVFKKLLWIFFWMGIREQWKYFEVTFMEITSQQRITNGLVVAPHDL